MKITVLGSGSWGSALSIHFGRSGFEVVQWCRELEVVDYINKNRENPLFLKGFKYPITVKATSKLEDVFSKPVELVISVIPTQFSKQFWKEISSFVKEQKFICASKGIEIETLKTLSDVYEEVFGRKDNYYVLSGPTFAKEVAAGLPAAAVIAGFNEEKTLSLVKTLNTKSFRLYASSDVRGVELGGALKNVIAIATGISDGMNLGFNARAALITRGLHEIKKLGRALGAKEETFFGLSGLGDLILTCTGDLSRNRQFGLSIGRGSGVVDRKFVVEGVYTVKAVIKIAEKLGIEMPISEAVYKVIYEGRNPKEVMKELMARPVKEENY